MKLRSLRAEFICVLASAAACGGGRTERHETPTAIAATAEMHATAVASPKNCDTACELILVCVLGGGYGYGFGYSTMTYGIYGSYSGYGGYGPYGYGIYGYAPDVTLETCVDGCHVLDGSEDQDRLIACIFENKSCPGRMACD